MLGRKLSPGETDLSSGDVIFLLMLLLLIHIRCGHTVPFYSPVQDFIISCSISGVMDNVDGRDGMGDGGVH